MTATSVHDVLLRPVISEKSVAQTERNLLLVRGAVPGARNGLLLVQKAK